MTTEAFIAFKTFFQLITAILAVLLNSLLITLIITKSPPKMGTYRHLMCFLSFASAIFAIVDCVVGPDIYSKGSAFIMVMDMRNRIISPLFATVLINTLCGCYAFTVFGIAVHFIYRFFALERRGRLRYFRGPLLVLWLFVPLVGGVHWAVSCWYFLSPSPINSNYLRPIILEVSNVPIEQSVYSAAVFWLANPAGPMDEVKFSWRSGWGLAHFMGSMTVSFTLLAVFGFKSWMKVKDLRNQGESQYAKNLQMQLYKALVAQTIVPVLLLFVPFSILFLCPLFLIDCPFLEPAITLIYAAYPAIDPLPILYFIDDYKNAIRGLFCKSNGLSVAPESQVIGRDGSTY